MATYSASIAASTDDADQGGSTVDTTGTTLNANNSNQYIGLRFTSVTIPSGSTITAATLDLDIQSASYDDPDTTIYGDDTDNASTFTTASNNISGRTATTASVTWTASNIGAGVKPTPDIATVIQEIIDRAGWSSGNALALIIKGNGTTSFLRTRAYDGTGSPAKLNVTYTTGGGSGQPTRTLHQFRQRTS